jgi:nicotinamidase-related amidase
MTETCHNLTEPTLAVSSDRSSNEIYARQGMGGRLGFGESPAVLVIDMQRDFCDPNAPSTLHPNICSTFGPIKALTQLARKTSVPVIYTQGLVAADGSSAGLWKQKMASHASQSVQIEGSPGAAIVEELRPLPGDRVVRKWRPSAFFRTDLEVFLGVAGIDTLLICGTSMSGCVRATAVDAFMRDIRPIIVREAVADRSEAVLQSNLFDVDQKYGDVVALEPCLTYLAERSPPG